MIVVVAYDVSTETKEGRRRLRRMEQACKDCGQCVQKSVFECILRGGDWVKLKHRLLQESDLKEDSLRFYFPDETARARTEHHGVNCPVDVERPRCLSSVTPTVRANLKRPADCRAVRAVLKRLV